MQWSWNVDYSNDEDSAGYGVAEPISIDMFRSPTTSITGGPDPQPVGRQPDGRSGRHVRARAGDRRRRRHPRLRHAGLRASRTDAVPGRLNETYFKAEREGVFYGQCSELCGKDHAFMPIDDPRRLAGQVPRLGGAGRGGDLPRAYQTLAATTENRQERQEARGPLGPAPRKTARS